MGSPNAKTTHRYAALDTYRFFAASAVVICHFEGSFLPFLHTDTMQLIRLQHFVDFFFVLSGFVIMCTYGHRMRDLASYGDFLWRRFARLYPLHVATTLPLAAVALFALLAHYKLRVPEAFDLRLLPTNLLLIQAWGENSSLSLNEPSWSISAEVFVYLLFPLLALLLRRVGAGVAIGIAFAFALITELVRAHYGMRIGTEASYDFGNLRAVPSFLSGMAIYAIVDAIPPRPISWAYAHVLALLILALMLLKVSSYAIVALFPLLVLLLALAERGGRKTILTAAGFVLLGNASFAIYLLQAIMGPASVVCARALHLTSPLGLTLVAIVFYVLIVAAGLASYRWFETPARRWLSSFHPFGSRPRREPATADLAAPAIHQG